MPLQNRVQPDGQIAAHPARGTFTGNRGILHTADRQMGAALWKHRAWICCTLDWQGRKRTVMTGRNWTELFFLDEAVALAAGHRPCAYCRRADYARYCTAWARAYGKRDSAPQMDAALHRARAIPGARALRHVMHDTDALPDGAMILHGQQPHLIAGAQAHRYTPAGYSAPIARPSGHAICLTPQPNLDVLAAGYSPKLHHSFGT